MCSVCLGELVQCCRAPCAHRFCKDCILRVLANSPPEWCGSCPLCRKYISVYNLHDAEAGQPLATPGVFALYGCVFVQSADKLGLASYHFDGPDDCYISYEAAHRSWRLDNGEPPPKKKPWTDYSFDSATHTFRGKVCWDPPFAGNLAWDYELVFSEDFSGIVGGRVVATLANGTTDVTPYAAPWEADFEDSPLVYIRFTSPPTTIYGSVYVQGPYYAAAFEGVASYHFERADRCYISYANAPDSWLLENGDKPPVKKGFSSGGFDPVSRTFQGVVEWNPAFGGAVRWEYTMIFSADFSSITGGYMQPYGPGGRRLALVRYGNPRALAFRRDMYYVRKPGALMDCQGARQLNPLTVASAAADGAITTAPVTVRRGTGCAVS